jgi:SAM-dependent methyltransferase
MWNRLKNRLRRHGVAGALKLLPGNIVYVLSRFGRRRRRLRRALEEFDRRFGVDTAGYRSITTLDMPIEVAAHAVRYQPIPDIETYLRALEIRFAEYTFIDYGCGKGRALLMASEYPFKEIIGVEYAAELIAVARTNMLSYRSSTQQCRRITVAASDARMFEPPATPTVFFLYNPFDEVVLEEVLVRIRNADPDGRPKNYLIYVDPRHRSCVEAIAEWKIAADRGSWDPPAICFRLYVLMPSYDLLIAPWGAVGWHAHCCGRRSDCYRSSRAFTHAGAARMTRRPPGNLTAADQPWCVTARGNWAASRWISAPSPG